VEKYVDGCARLLVIKKNMRRRCCRRKIVERKSRKKKKERKKKKKYRRVEEKTRIGKIGRKKIKTEGKDKLKIIRDKSIGGYAILRGTISEKKLLRLEWTRPGTDCPA